LDVVALKAMSKLHHFNSQGLSNMLWSYGKLKSSNLVLFKAAGDSIEGMKDLSGFMPQALLNIVWSYATAGEAHPKLFSKFGDHIIVTELQQFKPQDFSNILWSFSTAGESHPKLFSKLGDHIVAIGDLGQFKSQELSNLIWAFATAGKSHPQLFSKLGNHIVAIDNLNRFDPQALSNIIWSYATAGKSHPQLYNKLANHTVAMKDLSSFLPQELSNIAWSYAVANVNDPSIFNSEFIASLQLKVDDFGLKELSQLYQWQLWQDELKSGINLPSALCEKCRQTFVSQSCRSSRFQYDVISELSCIGLRPKEEVLTSSGYRLDALVEVNEVKVGIEVDRPYHFVNKEAIGSTLLKRRQVSTLDDLRIVSVPYWEWGEFGNNGAKKQDYLRAKLGLHPL
jgi:hypothetical protein